MSLPTQVATEEPKRAKVPLFSHFLFIAPFSAAVIGERVALASAIACVIIARCIGCVKAVTPLHDNKDLLEVFGWGAWATALAHLNFEIRQGAGVICIFVALSLYRNRQPRGDIRRDICTMVLHLGVAAVTVAIVWKESLLTGV